MLVAENDLLPDEDGFVSGDFGWKKQRFWPKRCEYC